MSCANCTSYDKLQWSKQYFKAKDGKWITYYKAFITRLNGYILHLYKYPSYYHFIVEEVGKHPKFKVYRKISHNALDCFEYNTLITETLAQLWYGDK